MDAQYGDEFLKTTYAQGWAIDVVDECPTDPFVRQVGVYSAIVLLRKGTGGKHLASPISRVPARSLHGALIAKYGTLEAAGCRVRVGPALGAGRTFIVEPDDPIDVEPDLIRPFVEKRDLIGGEVVAPRLRVVVPYDRNGRLINPTDWPRFARWAEARKSLLANRSQFRNSERYWRTIDAVNSQWLVTPKLLLPELCNNPLVTLDRTDSIPAHSIYAIWSEEWPIEILQRVLSSGLLELTAKAESPKLKAGWMRFYKRFIKRTPLPKWSVLTSGDRASLATTGEDFDDSFSRLFGFRPGAALSP
jgi:hypothetical protein